MLNQKMSTGSTHPLLSFSRPAPMLYLHIACLPPNIVVSFLANAPSNRRARVTSLRLAFYVQEKVPEFAFQCISVCSAAPYLRRFSLERRTPLRPQLYWICNTHPSPFSRLKPVIHMGESGEFSGTCRAGNLRRYDCRDNTRTVHDTLDPILDLSPQPMAHGVTSTISRPARRDSSKPAKDSYLLHLRRIRTHTIFIVPHGHMVVSGETLRTIENASEM